MLKWLASLIYMKKKSVIICGIKGTIFGLFLLAAAAVPSVSAFTSNCVDIECLKEKLRLMCETDPKLEYLDYENILRCIDAREPELMKCIKGIQLV